MLRSLQLAVPLAATLFLVTSGSAVSAKDAKVDPQAEQLVRKVSDYYAGLKTFRTVIAASMKISSEEVSDVDKEMTLTYDIAIDRPNRLSAVLKTGSLGATIVSDGKQLFAYLAQTGKYCGKDAPKTLEAVMQAEPIQQLNLMKTLTFFSVLVSAKPYDAFLNGIEEASLAGIEEIDGVKCQRIKFAQENMPWEMWVETGEKPLVKRIKPDMSAMLKGNPRVPKDIKLEVAINFKNWILDLKPGDDDFKFVPPPDAKKSDSPFEQPGGEAPHALLGKSAPGFELALLEGGKMKLADLKGKQVVILDFWATWCGPCVAALPTIAEVAGKYKAKGVTFVAVNLKEEPETIRDFLKENDLKISVALDEQGEVANQFLVTGIPQTVIVGKDGTVQAVHVGLSPDLKERLTKELDDLLAGKKLSGEKEK